MLMRTRILLTAALSLSPAVAACANPFADEVDRIGVDRATLAREAEGGGVPVLVPLRLPDGYRLLDVSGSRKADGAATVRELTIARMAGDDTATVETCLQDRGAGMCDSEQPGKSSFRRVVEGVEIVVRWESSNTEVDDTFWRDVPFTADLDDVRWLD